MKKYHEKPLLSEDYLIRMINLMLVTMARLVGLINIRGIQPEAGEPADGD